jgi:hypothetical protein
LAPCPLAKELIPIHPRKVFFYLTTSPHQPLPATSDDILSPNTIEKRVFSPSISNASSLDNDDEEAAQRDRERLSPSPEIDLSSPELDELNNAHDVDATRPPTPAGSFSGRSSLSRDGQLAQSERLSHNHRAASPPLEGDEREFTQMASSVRDRGMSLDGSVRPTTEAQEQDHNGQGYHDMEETAEITEMRNRETAHALFGVGVAHARQMNEGLQIRNVVGVDSSPIVKARELHVETKKTLVPLSMPLAMDVEMKDVESNWELKSPENVELEELDDLLGGF